MEPMSNGVPGFINRELEKIDRALRSDIDSESYAALYAAQQALSWAIHPDQFALSRIRRS